MQENNVASVLAPEKNIGVPMPSSWNYGSFHPNSRFYGAVMQQIQVRGSFGHRMFFMSCCCEHILTIDIGKRIAEGCEGYCTQGKASRSRRLLSRYEAEEGSRGQQETEDWLSCASKCLAECPWGPQQLTN